MLENELDASNFLYNGEVYTKEFEGILSKITTCYLQLRKDNIEVPLNDENGIRDILVNNYINNPEIKKSIELNYFVLPEVPESNSTGRTDIRIFSPNTFYNQDEYYIIECKRIDHKACRGKSGLNYEYINNGINRFITGKYSSHYKTNAMLGFIIDSLDIHNNIEDINYLLKNNFSQFATTCFLQRENFIENFEFHYSSTHLTNDKQDLKLYHLMFSFV
jgi:hypothetical protein